jgi:hypothetical protein
MHEALHYAKTATPAAAGSSGEPPRVPKQVAPILLSPPANLQFIRIKKILLQ